MIARHMLALFTLLVSAPLMAQTLRVQVEGAVAHPGTQTLPAGSLRAQALLAAQPTDDAYRLGAALLRPSNLIAQTRLKAGLLFDLQALAQHEGGVFNTTAIALHDWLDALRVTGREPMLQLDPRRLEVDAVDNKRLEDGERFIYPRRPSTITVVGAVTHACALPHVPLQDAKRYLRDCVLSKAADVDTLFVIQPDGRVQTLGSAAWNRSDVQALAPGAVIFVPIAQRRMTKVDVDFNAQFAQFLATQVLPVASAEIAR